jgi:hypothetical protein
VPLALVALARLTATPRSPYLALAATCLLTGAGATLSRAGAAAFAAGLLVLCWAMGARAMARAAAGPLAGAGVALLGRHRQRQPHRALGKPDRQRLRLNARGVH